MSNSPAYGLSQLALDLPNTSSNIVAVSTSGITRLYIDPNGNVGIGTTVPLSVLDVGGQANFQNNVTIAGNIIVNNITSNNSISFSNLTVTGNVIAASFQPTSSTIATTGMFLPAVNSLGLATNGSERMRIDTSGNVGIGTTSTSAPLVVAGSATAVSGTFAGGNTVVRLQSLVGSSFSEPAIDFGESTLLATARIASKNEANGGGSLIFINRDTSSLTSTLTERMRINSSGDVQIGTSADAGNTLRYLDVQNTNVGTSAGAIIRLITNNAAGSATTTVDIVKYKNGQFVLNNNDSAGYTTFGTAGTERMRIDSSGNVGIGISSPNAKLNVVAGDAASATNQVNISGGRTLGGGVYGSAGSILFTNSYWSSGYGAASISGMDSGSSGGFLGFSTTTNGSGTTGTPTERMRITSTGFVGINDTSPGANLTVGNGTGSTSLFVYGNVTGSKNSYVRLTDTSGTSIGLAVVVGGVTTVNIEGGSGISYLNGGGSVGIGTNSSAARLTVRGDTGDNATIDIKNNTTNIWKLWNDNGASALNFQYNGTTTVKFNSSGTANATQYTTVQTTGGSTMYVNQQQTTSVSTSATTILATPTYATLALVHGSDGTNRFSDLVLMSVGTGTVNVISSLNAGGSPAARTYTQASSTFKLAMASGTYTVQVSAICMNS